MRPVNLIPAEERSGSRRPMRGGPLAYIVLGALLGALLGVILLVSAGNQISDRKGEVAVLKAESAAVEAHAAELAPYSQFHEVRNQRTTTVANLADSRFDWPRVMHELSLVLPSDVWLTNLTGTVRPEVSVAGAESISLRSSSPGPALVMVGCAAGQESVARFITVLKDIDGVTRVGLPSSELPSGNSGSSEGSESANGNCQTRNFIAQFQIVVAFDAAPIPAATVGAGEAPEATEAAPEEPSSEASGETSTTPEGE